MLVGRSHVGLFKIIKELQKEQNQTESNIESVLIMIKKIDQF